MAQFLRAQDSPRDLHHQGKPQLRSGARRSRARQRRSVADLPARGHLAQSSRTGPPVRHARQFFRQRRGERRRLELEYRGASHGFGRENCAGRSMPGTGSTTPTRAAAATSTPGSLRQRAPRRPIRSRPAIPTSCPATADISAPDAADDDDNSAGAGYLWDGALRAKLSVRNYGFFIDLFRYRVPEVAPGYLAPMRDARAVGTTVAFATKAELAPLTDPYYPRVRRAVSGLLAVQGVGARIRRLRAQWQLAGSRTGAPGRTIISAISRGPSTASTPWKRRWPLTTTRWAW